MESLTISDRRFLQKMISERSACGHGKGVTYSWSYYGTGTANYTEWSPRGWPGGTPRPRLHSLSGTLTPPEWLGCVRVVRHFGAIHLETQRQAFAF